MSAWDERTRSIPAAFGRAALAGIVLLSCLGMAGCGTVGGATGRPAYVDVVARYRGPAAVSLAVAPDGLAAASLDYTGRLKVYTSDGQERLSMRLAGARMISISNSAGRIIVAGMGRRRWWVRLIGTSGRTIWHQYVNGRVLAVTISPDGANAYASTTMAHMYAFRMSGRLRWRRLHTSSDLDKLTYDATTDSLLVSTSAPAGFGTVDVTGKTHWWKPQPAGQFSLQPAADGSLIVTTLASFTPVPQVALAIYTGAGRQIFSKRFPGYEPRVAVSSSGDIVALSYRRKLWHKKQAVMERRIALYSISGRSLWEQGGLFFKPVLAGLEERPLGVLVAENYSLLSALDQYGRIAWRGPVLQANLLDLVHDEGWKLAWARFQDGSLELWRLGAP